MNTIYAMLLCVNSGTYCSVLDDGGGGLQTYPTVEACKAAELVITENYRKGGSAAHGECVSKHVAAWAPVN